MKLDGLNQWIPSQAAFIVLDPDRCTACGGCVRVCVAGIWTLDDEQENASLAPDYPQRCLECGACDQVCDARAITFRYPPGGTGVVYEQG